MPATSIQVEHLSKSYRIGPREPYKALREAIPELASAPWRALRSKLQERGAGSGSQAAGGDDLLWALRNVSFTVPQGEAVGVIGHNGAGKSTLLKVLARITRPAEGCATVYGRVGSLLEVGTGFHPELTGRENIYLNGAILGMRKAEITRKFDQIVDFAEVEKFLDTPVKRYSSGMYVRLAFAVAAHLEPEILIVDEVLAVGDAAFQRKCMGKMGDVAQEGRTVLFVSHNMNAIMRLCSRALLLRQGRLVEDGPASQVVSNYLAAGSGSLQPAGWVRPIDIPRRGNGQVKVTAFRYGSANPAVKGHAYPGGPLEVELALESDASRPVGSLAVMLYDQNGVKLVNADSISLGQTLQVKQGENRVKVRIHQLPLKAGDYVLGWWMADPLGRVFDFVDSGYSLQVIDTETNSLGKRPQSDGAVWCDFEVIQVE